MVRLLYGAAALMAALALQSESEQDLAQNAIKTNPEPTLSVLVPAYFYPASGNRWWPALNAAARRVPLTAILNPASGPGLVQDRNYVSAVTAFRAAGGRLIAYIHTSYGQRPIDRVTADLLAYQAMYAIDGFFIDEMTSQPDSSGLLYYATIYNYIKSLDPQLQVIGNPGTSFSPVLLSYPLVDVALNFESPGKAYQPYQPADWVRESEVSSFGHLVYGVRGKNEMRQTLHKALQLNTSVLYITDDNLPNPWDTLPAYWDVFIDCVAAINTGATGCSRPSGSKLGSGSTNYSETRRSSVHVNQMGLGSYP